MVRSIRWRLQLWYAAVLVAVTATAAGVTYAQSRAARLDQIDTRLRAGVAALDALLRTFPPHELEGDHPGPPDGDLPDDGPPPRNCAAARAGLRCKRACTISTSIGNSRRICACAGNSRFKIDSCVSMLPIFVGRF